MSTSGSFKNCGDPVIFMSTSRGRLTNGQLLASLKALRFQKHSTHSGMGKTLAPILNLLVRYKVNFDLKFELGGYFLKIHDPKEMDIIVERYEAKDGRTKIEDL